VYIPALGQDDPESWSSGPGPKGCFILDPGDEVDDRRLGTVKNALVTLFPHHPGREQHNGCQDLAQGFVRCLLGQRPPVAERVMAVRWAACHPKPGKDLVSDLARESAGCHEVSHGLHLLVAQEAAWVMLKSTALQPSGGPAAVKIC
jgi:hypothetical protein